MASRSETSALSAARRLRPLPEVFASVQHSGCAWSDFGDGTRRRDCARAGAGGGNRKGLGGSAEERSGDREKSDEPEPVSAKKLKGEKLLPASVVEFCQALSQKSVIGLATVVMALTAQQIREGCDNKKFQHARLSTRDRVRRDSGADDCRGVGGVALACFRAADARAAVWLARSPTSIHRGGWRCWRRESRVRRPMWSSRSPGLRSALRIRMGSRRRRRTRLPRSPASMSRNSNA